MSWLGLWDAPDGTSCVLTLIAVPQLGFSLIAGLSNGSKGVVCLVVGGLGESRHQVLSKVIHLSNGECFSIPIWLCANKLQVRCGVESNFDVLRKLSFSAFNFNWSILPRQIETS